MARPAADIDLKHFEKLCAYHFTVEEMAAAFNLSKRTLLRKLKEQPYKTLWECGEANGRQLVKRRGFELMAMDNSAGVQAWIHQTRHILKWADKSAMELTGKNGGPISTVDLTKATDEQLAALEALFGSLAGPGENDIGDQGGKDQTGAAT